MFLEFFFSLRAGGLKVSVHEWMTLMDAMEKGLAHSSLLGFYHLCRCVLIKSEIDYDRFDRIFTNYFGSIEEDVLLPKRFWEWLSKPIEKLDDRIMTELQQELETLLERIEKFKKEQKKEHNKGKKYIGAGGTAPIGHSGYNPAGIRIGDEGRQGTALQIAGQRQFKDFREDNILSMRDFQVAFRRLRQFSNRLDVPRTELNINKTIDDTCSNAGYLKIAWDKPRKNSIKLLMLFDSDGSMKMYRALCSKLFHSISISNRFKDLKVYYFHNCIYDNLYTDPTCTDGEWLPTKRVLNNLNQDYRVIIVSDGCMAASELLKPNGDIVYTHDNKDPGKVWLERFKNKYDNIIWLNPLPEMVWDKVFGAETLLIIKDIFPMYELSLTGLKDGIGKLLSYR